MDERKDTGKVIDMQAMLKSMEMEWGKVKDQEMESIKKEVSEEILIHSGPRPEAGLENIVITPYSVKKSSSRSEALMAFHERKRIENLKSQQLNSTGVICQNLTPTPPPPTSVTHPQSTSPSSESEDVMMEVALSPPSWINSPLSDVDDDEGVEVNDEEVEAIMMKKYAAEGFLHNDSNDNLVSESDGEKQSASAVGDVRLEEKTEEGEETNVEEVMEEDVKTTDEMEVESVPNPPIVTSWRQAIGSSEFLSTFHHFKF